MNGEVDRLRARIEALERALSVAAERTMALEKELEELRADAPDRNKHEGMARPKLEKRSKSMSRAWVAILSDIGDRQQEGATLDAIEQYVKRRGFEIKRRAIQAQLSNYKKRKLIEHVGEARYRLTSFGRMMLARELHK